jgi:hypothetical protein
MIHEISPDAYCTLHFYIKIEEMKCKSHIESTLRSLYWPKAPHLHATGIWNRNFRHQ